MGESAFSLQHIPSSCKHSWHKMSSTQRKDLYQWIVHRLLPCSNFQHPMAQQEEIRMHFHLERVVEHWQCTLQLSLTNKCLSTNMHKIPKLYRSCQRQLDNTLFLCGSMYWKWLLIVRHDSEYLWRSGIVLEFQQLRFERQQVKMEWMSRSVEYHTQVRVVNYMAGLSDLASSIRKLVHCSWSIYSRLMRLPDLSRQLTLCSQLVRLSMCKSSFEHKLKQDQNSLGSEKVHLCSIGH